MRWSNAIVSPGNDVCKEYANVFEINDAAYKYDPPVTSNTWPVT
jgi:hypothetical protein